MDSDHIEGDIDVPYLTERERFRDVLLTGRLRKAIKKINLDDESRPWLDDDRVNEVVGRLERISAPKLMEANRDGTIMVTAPHQAELIDIEMFFSEKRIWICQKLAQKKALNRKKAMREFVNGQGFLYLGKSYWLKLIDDAGIKPGKSSKTGPLRLWHGYFELTETEKAKAIGKRQSQTESGL